MKPILLTAALLTGLAACQVRSMDYGVAERNLGIALVEMPLRIGMGRDEVLKELGEASYMGFDSQRREVWTYDSCVYDVETRDDGSFVVLAFADPATMASSTHRRTVIISFDADLKVRDVADESRRIDYPVD